MNDKVDDIAKVLFPGSDEDQPQSPQATNPEVMSPEFQQSAEAQAPETQSEASDEAPPAEVLDTLEAVAEKAGVKAKDLYKVQIPMGKGEDPITLGEWKDRVQDLRSVDQVRAETEDERDNFRAERLKFQQELQVLGNALQHAQQTGKLDDDTVARAAQAYQAEVEQQNQLARAAAPELAKDETVEQIDAVLEKYGAPKGVVRQGVPAWMQLALHRLSVLEGRLDAAKKSESKPKPKRSTAAPSKAGRSQQLVQAAREGRADPVAAIASLLE